MKTYIVHFVGRLTGTSFKVGEYKSKKAIKRAQDKYSLQYGAHLGITILEKDTLNEVSIWQVA